MSDYFSCIFHRRILAFFILVLLSGCGYKGPPFYSEGEQSLSATAQNTDANSTSCDKGGVRILRDE
nr:lipoprotein [uncultured Campylobacter sp.]